MLILKIEYKGLEAVGGLEDFIEKIFLKRNWDTFLTLVIQINEERLNQLLKNGILKTISRKIDLRIELNDTVQNIPSESGIRIIDPKSYLDKEIIAFDSKADYSSIDNILVNILDFEKGSGLIPTIIQDQNNVVLMLAYSTKESLKRAIKTRKATYFSRSRNKLWIKGEESGNVQKINKILFDCDADSLLFKVEQIGFACHTGNYSCFQDKQFSINFLYEIINDRIENSDIDESYTKKLSEDYDLLISKIQEESNEVIDHTDRDNLVWEIADLTYFTLILMAVKNIKPNEIIEELRRRHK